MSHFVDKTPKIRTNRTKEHKVRKQDIERYFGEALKADILGDWKK